MKVECGVTFLAVMKLEFEGDYSISFTDTTVILYVSRFSLPGFMFIEQLFKLQGKGMFNLI